MNDNIEKLTYELFERIGLMQDDYLMVVSKITPEILSRYMLMACAIGYEGRNKIENKKHSYKEIPVKSIDKFGNEHMRFKSMTEADNYFGVTDGYVNQAVKNNWKCKGYLIRKILA